MSAAARGGPPGPPPSSGLWLDVYGLRIGVDGDWPEVLDSLAGDFEWFRSHESANAPDLTVSVWRRPPDRTRFGAIPQAFVTSRNAVFQSGATTIVDYFGRALAVYDRERGQLVLEGEEEHLVHESAYLFLLSRIGHHLDRRGLTRVHALGLSGANGAVLVLLPSGGGKTTLALRALQDAGVKLLSEDTPLLDHDGLVHPFPLRLGINESDAELAPAREVRRIERLEYGPKLVLPVSAFADRVEPNPQPLRHLVVGQRWLSGGGVLHKQSRRAVAGALFRDGVVGLGVAQMAEYVLRHGARDLLLQGRVAASRTHSCARGLLAAQAWQLQLSPDTDQNWTALGPLLNRPGNPSPRP
jgi:hypothetical protein